MKKYGGLDRKLINFGFRYRMLLWATVWHEGKDAMGAEASNFKLSTGKYIQRLKDENDRERQRAFQKNSNLTSTRKS